MMLLKGCNMWNVRNINYISRVVECDDNSFRFDIMYDDKLVITDNVKYESVDLCIDALCKYMKKLCSHSIYEPFEVKL